VTVHPDARLVPDEPFAGVILSGSFNPLHCGHETMLRVAGKFLGLPVAYELPVVNADKPALTPREIERRLWQSRRYPVILTRVPLFREKAELFPGCTFAVGYDTAVRLVDPRYYGGPAGRDEALADIAARGVPAARRGQANAGRGGADAGRRGGAGAVCGTVRGAAAVGVPAGPVVDGAARGGVRERAALGRDTTSVSASSPCH
jgi:hypothetical protein